MVLSYSSVIDWVLDPETTLTEADALQLLPEECRRLVLYMLYGYSPHKMSFGYNDSWRGVTVDFTPRRGHPQARQYLHWIRWGPTPLLAVRRAQLFTETAMQAALHRPGDSYADTP